MYVCVYVCMYVCIYIYMYLCMYVCMYVCMYICIYIYVCMYICMFVGEERDGAVMGMHNWIQLWNEERNKRLDYKGFIRPKGRQSAATGMNVMSERMIDRSNEWTNE